MSPIKVRILCVEIAQSGWRGNGAPAVCHRLIGSFGRPIIADPAGEAFLADLTRGRQGRRQDFASASKVSRYWLITFLAIFIVRASSLGAQTAPRVKTPPACAEPLAFAISYPCSRMISPTMAPQYCFASLLSPSE